MVLHCDVSYKEKFEIECGTHRSTSLIITLCGEYEYTTKNISQKILPFTPVVFRKGVSFRKRIIKPISYIIIRVSHSICHTEILEYDETDINRLRNTVLHIENAILKKMPLRIIEHFVNDILLTSKQKITKENDIAPAYKYISEHFSENINLKTLAGITGYSIQTLIHKFKSQYGITPINCITDFRISKAKELLVNTNLSISQIGENCGYNDVYYFSNSFKKAVGISPLKFRQNSVL